MKFLGGFLKFLSILLMLIGTAACTALVFLGITDDMIEPILVGVGIFLAFLFVGLGVMGTGMALSHIVKLKKKVALLEQKLWSAPVAVAPVAAPAVVSEPAESNEPVAAPVSADPVAEALAAASPKKNSIKRWLPVIIGGALVLIAIVIFVLPGKKEAPQSIEAAPQQQQSVVELPPVEIEETEPTEGPAKIEVVELPLGSMLNTGWVEMTFDEVIVEEDIQKSVTIDNVTRITGPDPLPGQVYVCLSGTIKNISTGELPVYDFFEGRFAIGDYQYSVSANDCDILSPDGSLESEIDPLLTYEYRIYTAIPVELQEYMAAGEPSSFTFGFYDGFDNQELASNRAFSDDAIAECPYQFFIPFQ